MIRNWSTIIRKLVDFPLANFTFLRILTKHQDKFHVRANQVYRKIKMGDDVAEVRYALFARRAEIVKECHTSFGHLGTLIVYDILKKRWWWPNMKQDIQDWLKTCQQCQLASDPDRNKHHAPMKPLDIPEPFFRWHFDFIGELPTTPKGNRWILVAVDYTTNWTIARAVPETTGPIIADFLFDEIVMRFGWPGEITTDRGPNFMSNVLSHYLGKLKVHHLPTSAFHPRSNSKAERTNGILKSMLRKYVKGTVTRWDDYLNTALFACRIRNHRTTKVSPFYVVYGQHPRVPGESPSS